MYAEALKPITDTMRKFPGVWDLPDARRSRQNQAPYYRSADSVKPHSSR